MFSENTWEEREKREKQKKYTKIFLSEGLGLFSAFLILFSSFQIFYNEHILHCFDLENITVIIFQKANTKVSKPLGAKLKKKKKKKN